MLNTDNKDYITYHYEQLNCKHSAGGTAKLS